MIIKTPSRLHLTLLDLNGSMGRIDGGVGLTLENPRLILEMEELDLKDNQIEITFKNPHELSQKAIDDYKEKIASSANNIMEKMNFEGYYRFTVHETFPPHSGLGSGTQISLAVGKMLSEINDHALSADQIAQIVGRGGTSGIGVASFESGGFIVDGGHRRDEKLEFLPSSASKASPPPIIARYDFPEDWDVILVVPNVKKGVYGEKEVNVFQEYCPIPLIEVQRLSHLLMMKMMPAVVEADLDAFGDAVNNIQTVGFKKIENQLQNPLIRKIMQKLRDAGAPGVGMSSFGPTIYTVTDEKNEKRDILKVAGESLEGTGGHIIETKSQNNGANFQ